MKYNSKTHVSRLPQLPCHERLMCILFDFIFPQKCTKYISLPPFTESNSVANFGYFSSKLMFEYLIMYVLNSKIVPLEVLFLEGTSGEWRFLHNILS